MDLPAIVRRLRRRLRGAPAPAPAVEEPSIQPFLELTRRLELALVDRIVADGALYFADPAELRAHALTRVSLQAGLVLEFGVFEGKSIRGIAEASPGSVHGFDTFEGLPRGDGVATWQSYVDRATFDVGGKLPEVPDNVVLHKGLFEQTLPPFVREQPGPVAFLHVDCDLYSSTRVIFEQLGERIVPGSIIVFDEYFNYPGWQFCEYKAFEEFVRETDLQYTVLGVATRDPDHQRFGHYGRLSLRVDERPA